MKKHYLKSNQECITSEFRESERKRQENLLGTDILEGAAGGGYYRSEGENKIRSFILKPEDSLKNLFPPIRKDVLEYFEKYDIAWWKQYEDLYFPTGQLLSSQIHCLNHLFWIRKDPEAILKLIQPIGELAGVHFEEVLHSFIDNNEAYFDTVRNKAVPNRNYISFEFVCDNIKSLGEGREKRGSKCTSVDAFVYARAGKEKWLIPIEWKYTEVYNHDKENDRNRYNKYLLDTSRLNNWSDLYNSEPYYEFSRQTLLMENLILRKPLVGKISQKYPQKSLEADNFLHVIVVPDGNTELQKDVKIFRETIKPEFRRFFRSIDPQELLNPIKQSYPELIEYLEKRYWNDFEK